MRPAVSASVLDALLAPCLTVLPEGFRIELHKNLPAWDDARKQYGVRALCAAVAARLDAAYREAYGEAFLFSPRCMAFELLYHLDAYLWTQGRGKRRHVTTLAFSREKLDASCRSVEIDVSDAYRIGQRLMFRYFFGVRREYRNTEQDPYAMLLSGRLVRVPFRHLFGKRHNI